MVRDRLRYHLRLDPTLSSSVAIAVAVPTVGIIVSETILYNGYVAGALVGHLLTLFACIFGPLVITQNADVTPGSTGVLQVFALVPLFRLVNLGMPVFIEFTLYWFPFVYAPLLPATYVVSREHVAAEPLDFKPRTALLTLPLAILAGAVLGYVEYQIIQPDALIRSLSIVDIAILAAIMVLFVGFVEELIFRGLLQRTLETTLGTLPGLVLASVVFGLMHSAYGTPLEIAFAAIIGLLFGIAYDKTRSLLAITFAHAALNVFLFGIYPHLLG